jgi:broad specificity phosphatase PhoE
MPDPLDILYKQNKQAQNENRNILSTPQQDSNSLYVPAFAEDPSKRTMNLGPENKSNVDEAGMYSSYISNPQQITAGTNINQVRAQNQPVAQQIGNIAARAIPDILAGTLGNLAAIGDVEDYLNVDHEVGNAVSRWAQDFQEETNKLFPIYRTNPDKTFDIGNSGWWMENASNLVNMAGSFALTGLITGGILGKLAQTLGDGEIAPWVLKAFNTKANKLVEAGKLASEDAPAFIQGLVEKHIPLMSKMTTAVNTLAMNQAFSIQSASGIYKNVYDMKLAEGDDDETAKQKAADAAALNINLNRLNMLVNFTSSGMFTKANAAIMKNYGGIGRAIVGETGQQALEMGMYHASDMEAMRQAQDGDNYSIDPERIIGHFTDPQGLESMFWGGLAGGVQTGLIQSHAFQAVKGMMGSVKDKAMSTYGDMKNAIKKINPKAPDLVDSIYGKSKIMDEMFQGKQSASSEGEHADVDNKSITDLAKISYNDNTLEGEISTLTDISKLDAKKESEVSGKPINIVQDSIDRAKLALDVVNKVKKAGDESKANDYLNPSEVLSSKMDLNDAVEKRAKSETNLESFKAELRKSYPIVDADTESKINSQAKPLQDEVDKAKLNEIQLANNFLSVTSPEYQKTIQAQKDAEDQKIIDEEKDKKRAASKNTLPVPPKSIPDENGASTVSSNIGDVTFTQDLEPKEPADLIHNVSIKDSETGIQRSLFDKYKLESKVSDIPEEDLKTLTGDTKTISLLKDGDRGYLVTPSITTHSEDGTITAPPQIASIDKKESNGLVPHMGMIRDLVSGTLKENPNDIKMKIGNKSFTYNDLSDYMKDKSGINNMNTAEAFTKSQLFDFLGSIKSTDIAPATNRVKIDPIRETIHEPKEDFDDNAIIEKAKAIPNGALLTTPNSVANLVEKYTIVDGKKIGTGEINQKYLVGSDNRKVFNGAQVMLVPHDEERIAMYNYDKNGNAIEEGGAKTFSMHNADSASKEEREIPIAIYLVDKNGERGDHIGFLRENNWLNEGGIGHRKNIAENDVDFVNEMVSQMGKVRKDITDRYLKGDSDPLYTKLGDISDGHPLTNSKGFQSVRESLPDILKDTKEKKPFGVVINGSVFIGDQEVSDISNLDMIRDTTSGTPVVILPSQNGKFYAMPVKSKKVNEISADNKHIKNGLLAHIGVNDVAAKKYNEFARVNELKNIDSAEGLRDYLKYFIYMEPTSIFDNTGSSQRPAVTIHEDSDRHTILRYGNAPGIPSDVDLTQIGMDMQSPNISVKQAAYEGLKKITDFIGDIRHNFQSDMLNKPNSFIGITDKGFEKLANSYTERYMNTLQTNIIPAGKSDGKNIYLIQPTISIDTDISKGSKAIIAPKVEEVKPTEPPKYASNVAESKEISSRVEAPKVESAIPAKRVFTKREVPGGGAELQRSDIGDKLPSISIETAQKIRNSDSDYIIRTSDNKMLSTSEEDAGAGSILTNFSDKMMKNDGSINVNQTLRDAYNSLSGYYNTLIDDYNNESASQSFRDLAESRIDSLDRILDKDAWNKIAKNTINRMQEMGISIDKNGLRDINNSEQFIKAPEDEYSDSTDRIELESGKMEGEDWNNNAVFSLDPMDTSSKTIKMLMWSLRDPSGDAIGLAQMVDPEKAYEQVLNIASQSSDRTAKGLIQSLDDEASSMERGGFGGNIFRQLHDKISNADLQTQIQFASTMNKNRNMFVTNGWDSRFGKLITFDSETKRADRVVLNEWKSKIANTLYRNKEYQGKLFEDAGSILQGAREFAKANAKMNPDKLNAKLGEYIKDALDTLGIKLADQSYSFLNDPKSYNKRQGYSFNGGKSLAAQFRMDGTKPLGIFSAMENAFKHIEKDDTIDTVFDKLNQSALSFLSKIEAKSSKKYIANSSIGVDGNTHYNFGIPTAQTIKAGRLLSDQGFVNALRGESTIYTKHASWLKDKNLGTSNNTPFKDMFKIGYKDGMTKLGSPKSTTRKAMSLSESLLSQITDFQNNGKNNMFTWDTTKSDKPITTVFNQPRNGLEPGVVISGVDGKPIVNRENLIKSDILDDAFGIVRGETERILSTMLLTTEERNQLRNEFSTHYDNNGQFFYGYKFLNRMFKFDNDHNMVPDHMIEVDVDGRKTKVKTSDFLTLSDPRNEKFLKGKIADWFIGKAKDDIQFWGDNDLIFRDSKGKITKMPVNSEYAKLNGLGKYEIDPETRQPFMTYKDKDKALLHLALDMNLNSQIGIHNSMMLISGDPAIMNKSVKTFIGGAKDKYGTENNLHIELGIDKAMAEYQKRLASDIAPSRSAVTDVTLSDGTKLPSKYRVIFTSDMNTDGKKYLESISKSLHLTADQVTSKGSDALEFISFPHKLDALLRDGAIDEKQYLDLKSKYNKGPLSSDDIKTLILGAGKPVQVPQKFVNVNGKLFSKNIYVKSAEMPLLKQMTSTLNGQLDAMRQSMEDNNIDRVIHLSAAKYGAENLISIYDKSGNILPKTELGKLFKNNGSEMDWAGFGYQQDQPYDAEKQKSPLVTQADKTLFSGFTDKTFNYKGEQVSGAILDDRKNSIRTQLSNFEEEGVDKDMGFSNDYPDVIGGEKFDKNKILDDIEKNASIRKWSPNAVLGLKNAIKGDVPLMMSSMAPKLETAIYTKYSDRAIKQDQPGGSGVQLPSLGKGVEGLTGDRINDINGIIKTKEYDPDKGLQMSESKGGKIMQIMVPFKFWDQMGNILSAKEFYDPDTKLLNINKVPEELLRIAGFRIPNQLHSSMTMAKIVGFLPAWYGDSCIVPPEITTQMGSDFDIDKLYMYWRNSFLTKDGKLTSIPSNIIGFDKDNNLDVKKIALAEWRYGVFGDKIENKKALQDKLDEYQRLEDLSKAVAQKIAPEKVGEEATVKRSEAEDFLDTEISDSENTQFALEDLGITKEDTQFPSMKTLTKKALQDSYFEMFDSVLSDPEVIEKSLTPLERPDLTDLANEVTSKRPKREYGDYIRQAQDYMDQAASRSGRAIFAKALPALANMEGKDIKMVKYDNDSDKYLPDTISKFKDSEGNQLDLYKINPLAKSVYVDPNGEKNNRTGIENLSIQLSGMVDNANKPVAAPNNLNSNTFNVSAMLSSLSDGHGNGVALDTNTRFLRQPGIKMLSELITKSKDTLATFDESANSDVREAMQATIDKLKTHFHGDMDELNKYVDSIARESYSPSDLLELEQTPFADRGSKEYLGKQIDLVKTFADLNDKAWLYSNATDATNIDPKGLGINYYENQNLLSRVAKAVNSPQLQNAGKLWSRDGSMRVYKNDKNQYWTKIDPIDKMTASGNNIRIAIEKHNALGKLMGYDSSFLNDAIASIESTKGLTNGDMNKAIAKGRKNISNGYKSFIYSKLPFLGENPYKNLVENHSLANELIDLKKDPNLRNNLFIQTDQTDTSLKYLQMDSRVQDGSSSASIIRGFLELATSENPRYRDYAENRIRYEYMTGGIQGRTSALKYIDSNIIEALGINRQIKNVMNEARITYDHPEFREKYFQNNPDEATFIKGLESRLSKDKETKEIYAKIIVDPKSKYYAGDDIVSKLVTKTADGDDIKYKDYVRMVKNGITTLFKLDNERFDDGSIRYNQIPLRGAESVSTIGKPMFSDYSKPYMEDIKPTIGSVDPIVPEIPATPKASDRMMKTIPDNSTVSGINNFLRESKSPILNWLGNIVDQLPESTSKTGITYKDASPDGSSSAEYDFKKNKIIIYKKEMSDLINKYGLDHAHETLAHEISHSIEHEAYKAGKNGDPKFKEVYDNVNSIFADAKEGLKDRPVVSVTDGGTFTLDNDPSKTIIYDQKLFDSVKNKGAEAVAREIYPKDMDKRNDLKLSLYSFSNPEEFMADLNSRPKLQSLMETVNISPETAGKLSTENNKSILRAFLDHFAGFFSKMHNLFAGDKNSQELIPKNVLEARFINSMILVDKMKGKPVVNSNNEESERLKNMPFGPAVVDKSLSWGQIKDMPVYSEAGVNVMRKQGTDEHFGNPFTANPQLTSLIQMENIPDAVQAYKDWLHHGSGFFGFEGGENRLSVKEYDKLRDQDDQLSWIQSQISQGKLDNQKLLYMKDKGEYYSHADALRDIVNGEDRNNLFSPNIESNRPHIEVDNSFKTLNLNDLAGTEQSKSKVKEVDNIIINHPEENIHGGESFNDFSNRVLEGIGRTIKTAPDSTVIVTHNTVFGLIHLWDEMHRPDELSKEFREEYVKQDSHPSDSFVIKGDNGEIRIARHGETEDNVNGNFRSDDTPLTPSGLKQARDMGKNISNISNIITSDLPRAIRTADILANSKTSIDLPGTVTDLLRGTEKDATFAFRDAIAKGLFKTKC